MKYLGLDLGSKTIGLAISDLTNTIATSIETIRFEQDNYDEALTKLETVVNSNNIKAFVLGLPKNMNNTLGTRSEITLAFKKSLEEKFNKEVILEDERLTSVISNNILIKADVSRNKRKKVVDKMAACIILQSFLDRL